MPASSPHDERVLVLAPLGRDGPVTAELLCERGLTAAVCGDAADASRQIADGAGALVVAEEALEHAGVSVLFAQLQAQPPWSELPTIILTRGGESRLARLLDLAAQAAGGATLLERPLAAATLLRALEVALRSRRRQYQVRDLLERQRQQATALEAARAAAMDLVDAAERSAAALRESEARLRTLYASMTEGLAIHEVVYDNGRAVDYLITDVNPAYERITGIARAAAVGRKATELYGSNQAPYLDVYARVAAGEPPVSFESYFPPMRRHFTISVFSPGKGRFATVFSDITAHKEAEVAVQEERDRLSALVANMQDEVWFADAQKRFTLANPAARNRFGLAATGMLDVETLAANLEVLRPDGSPRPVEESPPLRALKGEVVSNQEEIIRSPTTGELRYRQVNATPVRSKDGRIIGSVSVVRDITDRKAAEEKLRASEERLQEALRISRSFAFEWDTASDRVTRSLSCAALLGLEGEAATTDTGRSFFQRVHPDDRERFVSTVTRLRPDADRYEIQYRLVNPHAGVTVLEESGRGYFDAAGRLWRLIGITTDVTARVNAEEALHTTEELNRRTLQALPAHIAVLDREGRIMATNQAWAAFAAQNQAAGHPTVTVGANYLEVCRRAAAEQEESAVEALTGLAAVLAGRQAQFTMEYPCHGPQEQRWFYLTVVPLGAPGQGGAVVTHLNITERKLAEAELRQSQLDLARAQAVGQIGSWRLDTRQNVLTWSDENHRIFGVPRGTPLTYETFLAIVHPDDRLYVDTQWKAGLRGEPYDIEHRLVVDGEVKWVRETADLEFDAAGALLGGFGITQDITARKRVEEQLREANERFELVLAGAGGAIWDWDVSHHRVLFSSRWKSMRGFTDCEVSDAEEEWSRGIHPEDAPRVMAAVQAHFEGKTPIFAAEYRICRKDGSWLWIAGRGLARRDANGRVVRMAGSEVEITERKQAEQALRESESFHRQTLECIPGMVFTTRPDGYCDFQSQPWVDFTGVPMVEHFGDGWNKLLHPEDRPRAFAAWQDAVAGRAPYDLEYRVRRHDGEYEWFKVRARPIRGQSGQIVRWFGTALNIDDLVKARSALERSERLYRAIGESIDYGIWVCDPDGRNTYASESFLKLVGLSQEQCSNFGWGEVLHPDDAERTIAAWKECVAKGGLWDIEHRFRGVDGQWHPILARGVPVRGADGRILCWAGINLDISRLKRTEEELRASLGEKVVLLKEIHHRVKNNLQVVSSLINLQAETMEHPESLESLNDLRGRVRSMALVHEKLYECGSLARLNIADYASSLLHSLRHSQGNAAARVDLRLCLQRVELPMQVAVPCGLILNELASNALKHAFAGRSRGELAVSLAPEGSGRVVLRVRDDGVGLRPGLDWRQSPALGLKLVLMLTRQIHGEIEAKSGDIPGTEFVVTFPLPP